MTMLVPFNRPTVAGDERRYVEAALSSGHWSGDGPFTHRCQRILRAELGAPEVLLTTSCTHALELIALLLEFRPGDEVIVPSFTFVSTVNAFVLHGARPVFADIRPDTLNIDERQLERLAGPRTRTIVVVHYGGIACAMDPIVAFAERRGLALIEDNAHGLWGAYGGRPLGTFGRAAALSFHETKNITCGEGGALVLNDSTWIRRSEILREKGTDRSRFFRGEVDKYQWVDVGSSYLPSDLLAAVLLAQLEARHRIQEARRRVWDTYAETLSPWAEANNVRLPVVPVQCTQPYHLFYLLMPDASSRDALLAHLKSVGIHAVFHYLPLNASEMGARFGARRGDCPVSESISARLVRLPFYAGMTDAEQQAVIAGVKAFAFTAQGSRR